MTAEEICRDYRQAASPSSQIGVLADLNLVTKAEIIEILKRGGVTCVKSKKRRTSVWTEEKLKLLDKFLAEGKTQKEIACLLDISPKSVWVQLKETGQKKRKLRSG